MTRHNNDPRPNLWTCRRCNSTIDIGTDDLAGDEEVVAMRMAHNCRPFSGHLGVRLACSICRVEHDSTELVPVNIGGQRRHLCADHAAQLSAWWYSQLCDQRAVAGGVPA